MSSLLPDPATQSTKPPSFPPANKSKPKSNVQPAPNIQLPLRTRVKGSAKALISNIRSKNKMMNAAQNRHLQRPAAARAPAGVIDLAGPRAPAGHVIDLTASDDEDDIYDDALELPLPQGNMNVNANPAIPAAPQLGFQHQLNPYQAALPQQNAQVLNDNFLFGDYFVGDDDEELARAIAVAEKGLAAPVTPLRGPLANQQPHDQPPAPAQPPQLERVNSVQESLDNCLLSLLNLFPGICSDYVTKIYETVSKSSNRLVEYILDKVEKGTPYPKNKSKTLKRKRELDPDEELVKKYSAGAREKLDYNPKIGTIVRQILSDEFASTPKSFIDATLAGAKWHLFPAYRVLEEAERTFDPLNPPYNKIARPRRRAGHFGDVHVQTFVDNPYKQAEEPNNVEVYKELQAARRLRKKAEAKIQADRDAGIAEQENVAKAEREGTMSECGCCYCDYPLNRMVHCDGDILHWFCRDCARRNAEGEVGQGKYELVCMSTDGCTAGFANGQRAHFLGEKTKIALERNEQESNLRLAGIENLASCPFCPFAAEYPPVEIDKEFRCQAQDCEKVSCRLCEKESHIPKTCEESVKEEGLSIRRQIEEAMSAALIRKCNKCGTRFVKEEGCNKMTCTLKGCMNIQCYVCSKSCGYDHFNDAQRGGKPGNCPLFESVEERHNGEVSKAEKEAMDKVLADHPEFTAEDLKIQMSENVAKDDAARKARDARGGMNGIPHAAVAHLAAMRAAMAGRGPPPPPPLHGRDVEQRIRDRFIPRRRPPPAAAPIAEVRRPLAEDLEAPGPRRAEDYFLDFMYDEDDDLDVFDDMLWDGLDDAYRPRRYGFANMPDDAELEGIIMGRRLEREPVPPPADRIAALMRRREELYQLLAAAHARRLEPGPVPPRADRIIAALLGGQDELLVEMNPQDVPLGGRILQMPPGNNGLAPYKVAAPAIGEAHAAQPVQQRQEGLLDPNQIVMHNGFDREVQRAGRLERVERRLDRLAQARRQLENEAPQIAPPVRQVRGVVVQEIKELDEHHQEIQEQFRFSREQVSGSLVARDGRNGQPVAPPRFIAVARPANLHLAGPPQMQTQGLDASTAMNEKPDRVNKRWRISAGPEKENRPPAKDGAVDDIGQGVGVGVGNDDSGGNAGRRISFKELSRRISQRASSGPKSAAKVTEQNDKEEKPINGNAFILDDGIKINGFGPVPPGFHPVAPRDLLFPRGRPDIEQTQQESVVKQNEHLAEVRQLREKLESQATKEASKNGQPAYANAARYRRQLRGVLPGGPNQAAGNVELEQAPKEEHPLAIGYQRLRIRQVDPNEVPGAQYLDGLVPEQPRAFDVPATDD